MLVMMFLAVWHVLYHTAKNIIDSKRNSREHYIKYYKLY